MNISRTQQSLLQRLRQLDENLRVEWNDQLKTAGYLRGNLSDSNRGSSLRDAPFISADNFLSEYHPLFGINYPDQELVNDRVIADRFGMVHLSLQQQLESVPVEGGMVSLHSSTSGMLQTVFNKFIPGLNLNTAPKLCYSEAQSIVDSHVDSIITLDSAKPELFILTSNSPPRLCWRVKLYKIHNTLPECWLYDIDALTGEIVQYHSTSHCLKKAVAWGIGYYSRGGKLNISRDDSGTYVLYDQSRYPDGPLIETYIDSGQLSKSNNPNWNKIKTAQRKENQGPEVDAHRYAGYIVDYFAKVHGRNSYDDKGSTVKLLVHCSESTSWNSTLKLICISDNDNDENFDFESNLDIIAHEFTHAVTELGFEPDYTGESGAIDEALSDCFGAFISNTWYFDQDSWLLSTHGFRNLANPTNNGQWNPNDETSVFKGHCPDHYEDRYQGTKDDGGIHSNCTIISHAIYLLSNGGTHRKTKITVPKLGTCVMEALLYNVQNYQLIGNKTATFLDFRKALINACCDIYPCDQKKLRAIEVAFNAVGIIAEPSKIFYIPMLL